MTPVIVPPFIGVINDDDS